MSKYLKKKRHKEQKFGQKSQQKDTQEDQRIKKRQGGQRMREKEA